MPLKTFVKVGSITNLSDARYCAGMGVDLLGFRVVEGQAQYISPEQFQEIRGWITGPQVVAEIYGLQDAAVLDKLIELYRPDLLELSINELKLFRSIPLPFILNLTDTDESFNLNEWSPDYLITNHATHPSHPILKAVSTVDEVQAALEENTVAGIALQGGSEIRPGLKDFEALADILELLDVDH